MSKFVPVVLPIDGPMDTTGPASNRAPGTLVDSTDCDHRWWGPRTGLTQQTWPFLSAASFPNRRVAILDGNNSYLSVVLGSKRQTDLPTSWTVNLVVRPSGISHSAAATLPVFCWTLPDGGSGIETIKINFLGPGSAAGVQRTFQAVVTPTTAAGIAGSTTTISGTTQFDVGTGVANTYAVQLVRNEKRLLLYVNGTLEASTSTSNLGTLRHEGSAGTQAGSALLGGATSVSVGSNLLFAGRIYEAIVREGAIPQRYDSFRDYVFPWQPGVRLAVYGSLGLSSNDHAYERSKFKSLMTANNCTFTSITQPEPWAHNPVQGMTHFSDVNGRTWNVVMAGGTLYWRRVQ